mgnify:CR=1 FL=1
MSETLSQNPDSSPTTTDWSVLEGDYDKEPDVNQANPETTSEQFKEAARDVIAAREKLFSLSEQSRENPQDYKAWQDTRKQSVNLHDLIRRRNELVERMANNRPAE